MGPSLSITEVAPAPRIPATCTKTIWVPCSVSPTKPGTWVQELSYDAWGNRRDVDTWDVFTTLPTGILLARGFTGHEHIDLFDLINMDGRVYDPVLGRFLSPDPMIQNPENLQSLNRYSYCLNNPLSLTDPSGYSWLSDNWRMVVASAVAITVSVITCGTDTPLAAMLAGGIGGFAGGVTGALLSGANLEQVLKAGVVGGLIGAASGFLSCLSGGTVKEALSLLERTARHAFSNAWLNGMTGGDFKHGFITGALSTLGNGLINNNVDSRISKVACASALGGTIEEIGGGKFANGAITGAYGMLFNDLMHPNPINTRIRKYVDAMFPGRIPSKVDLVWQLTDASEGLTDPIVFRTAKKITVSIPKKLWLSKNKTLLIDCIDHELVHVGDFASGRTSQYINSYGPDQALQIMEYKAYRENLYYHTHMNTSIQYNQQYINYYQGRVDFYKNLLPNGWWK